jgi:hypothetical protein
MDMIWPGPTKKFGSVTNDSIVITNMISDCYPFQPSARCHHTIVMEGFALSTFVITVKFVLPLTRSMDVATI